ncbi:MAG TPA: nucleotidyltransferase domain-containing protein [Longimicrobiaceae bacterium]|nr:nucleotidyltransferase domain-containing protein [Longimicrobiaceae bacterium]
MRVLRELFRHGGEMPASGIAARVGLTAKHVRQVLGSLTGLAVVERVGQGRYASYRVRPAHPLHPALDSVFRAEEERFEQVLETVRDAARRAAPRAAWLYGSAARGDDRPGSDVDVAVVAEEEAVERVVAELRERLREPADALGVAYSVVGLTPADVLRLSAGDPWWSGVRADALALVGPEPERLAAQVRRAADAGGGAR